MYGSSELSPAIRGYLSDFVQRWRRLVGLRAAGSALALLATWIIFACAADRILHLSSSLRLGLLAAAGPVALALGVYRLRRLRAPIDWVAMAHVIEKQDPRFNQALITVTSRILGAPEHRGSDEILSQLLRDVEYCAADTTKHKLITLGSAAGPWALFLIAAASIVALARVPGLGGGRLLARLFEPTADIPPVTTTELRVLPHPREEVMQSESFRIDAEAHRLGNSAVMLFVNNDGGNWARYSMDDAGGGRFTYTINAVGRDLQYYVRAGDAVSSNYSVLVKRPPAVAEFRIRYTYPAYTRKPPFTLTNSDGTIEAPSGSDAVLTIVATEPLQSALLTIGNRKILMDKTPDNDPTIRTAAIHIQDNVDYSLDLISTREVRGGGSRMLIRATADHPPLVRLLQAGQTLRLNPRDILPLSYQAMDDYGLDAVFIVAQVNADAPVRIPLRLSGDHRRQEETANFDLGSLNFKIGDVLSLTILGRDTAGQETTSDELRVLVSPRSIDFDAHERIDELGWAAGFASTLADEMDQAAKATEDADDQKDHQSSAYLSAEARVTRHLTSASESATLLRQSLLRTIAHHSAPKLSTALAGWIDLAHQESETADDLFRKGGLVDGMGTGARDQLHRAADQAREMHDQLFTVALGERAAAVLADRDDLAAAAGARPSSDAAATERLNQTLQRAREEIKSNAAAAGVNASGSDADAQLRSRVEAAKELVASRHPVDLAAAAHEWSQNLQRDPHQRVGLDARLATAAQAEAVQADADLVRARDLELAARAAGAVEGRILETPKGKPISAGRLDEFADAMAALQREHALARESVANHPAEELKVAREAADRARGEMAKLAGEVNPATNAGAMAKSSELESLAMRAGAAAYRRDYKRAAEHDAALAQELSDAARKPGGRAIDNDASPATAQLVQERIEHSQRAFEQVTHQMKNAETEDHLGQAQEKLAQEARSANRGTGELLGRQRSVADQISEIERQEGTAAFPTATAGDLNDPNWRGRATAALLFAQEELAAMPQGIAAVQEIDRAHRKAVERAKAARHEIEGASPDRQAMLKRAADQAEQDARDSTRQLENAIAPVAPVAATDLADRLDPFAPEASMARDVVRGALVMSLTALQEASRNGSPDAVARAANDALQAIDAAQKELVRAQDAFTARDPLIAAKWFARAAADALAHHPGDLRTAMAHQANVSLALSKAWDRSVHRAAELRLAELPSLQAAYAVPSAGSRQANGATALSPNVVSRDWNRLHSRDADDLPATLSDPDPPGFEEPLRLYFEALGKAQEKAK